MLEFQEQNCQLTLEEGLKIYYDAFEDQESILKGDTLPEFIFGHDCTHVIFDLEVAFLFPWAVSLGSIGIFGFWSMMIFLLILTIGFIYEWKKGALEWE